jgi:hypothetical protein
VINYKRPENVARIITRLRAQSHPVQVTVVDTAAGPEFVLPQDVLAQADNVYRLEEDYGPFSRFVPAANYKADYTFLVDDDYLPGRKCVEHFLHFARLNPHVGLFGQLGRIIGRQYNTRDVPRGDFNCKKVHMLVRGYFLRRQCIPDVLRLWQEFPGPVRHDDILLAAAVRHLSGKEIVITPRQGHDTDMIEEELPDPHANFLRPGHIATRSADWVLYNRKAVFMPPIRPASVIAYGFGSARRRALNAADKLRNLLKPVQ